MHRAGDGLAVRLLPADKDRIGIRHDLQRLRGVFRIGNAQRVAEKIAHPRSCDKKTSAIPLFRDRHDARGWSGNRRRLVGRNRHPCRERGHDEQRSPLAPREHANQNDANPNEEAGGRFRHRVNSLRVLRILAQRMMGRLRSRHVDGENIVGTHGNPEIA